MRRAALLAMVGLAIGIGLGLLIGWRLWPVSYTNTAPHQLRQDYHDDYVLMVAAAYEIEDNLDAAVERLTLLDPEMPSWPVVNLAERLIAGNGNPEDIEMLIQLAQDLGELSPVLNDYRESQL